MSNARFHGLALDGLHERPPGGVRVTLLSEQQSDVDQAVDRLRSAGLSIVSLAPRKVSLEDAFMQIVHAGYATQPLIAAASGPPPAAPQPAPPSY